MDEDECVKYIQSYPQLKHILPSMIQGVAKSKNLIVAGQRAEFELRLGSYDTQSKRFTSGVGRNQGDKIVISLDQARWDSTTDWTEQHDYFYNLPDNIGPVRQEVIINSDNFEVTINILQKNRVWLCDCPKVVPFNASRSKTNGNTKLLCIRGCVSSENLLPPDILPPVINPSMVRIKQRKSYVTGAWRFDLTLAWMGLTRTKAEEAQANSPAIFEVELECIDHKYLMAHTDAYVAASALLKLTDLLDQEVFAVTRVRK